ncbi:MAG: hypothetical protein H5T84_03590 [Thermoleophilia bacterium]|nr:hypothetical protein [Thermoleophilia bacterium]
MLATLSKLFDREFQRQAAVLARHLAEPHRFVQVVVASRHHDTGLPPRAVMRGGALDRVAVPLLAGYAFFSEERVTSYVGDKFGAHR